MSGRWRAWARLLGGAAILAVLVWSLGAGPFVRGVRTVDAWSLAAATGIGAVTTVCCAWRWSLVARGLGVAVPLRPAIAAYYRSQFLNTTLPGGVLGDLHRGMAAGRNAGSVGRGLRAVGWERAAGQVVQVALAAVALLILPSPVRSAMPAVLALAVLALAVLAVAALAVGVLGLRAESLALAPRRPLSRLLGRPHGRPSRWERTVRAAGADLRDGVLARRAWPGILATSVVVVAGHAATFLVAGRATGVTAPPARMLPLALLILLAMAIPANVGGWGPREGVAAWAFGAAGLGAAQGLATAVAYGVLVLAANLPGALVLAWSARRPGHQPTRRPRHQPTRRPSHRLRPEPTDPPRPAFAHREGAAHG